jgi:hypothetical protein
LPLDWKKYGLDPPALGALVEKRLGDFELDFGKWNRRLFAGLVLLMAVGAVLYVGAAGLTIGFPYEFKGWAGGSIMHNAYSVAQGRNFYVDPNLEPSAAFCYTPMLPLLIAPLVALFGLKMWVGQAVAIAGFVAVLALVYRAGARSGGKRLDGFVAAGLLLATYGGMGSHYDDIHPDSWTIVFGLITLALAEAAVKKSAWVLAAALAAALSYFTKQTGISFAMGATIYLFFKRPRLAFIYVATLGLLLVAGNAAGQYLTGGTFLDYTLGSSLKQPILWFMLPVNLVMVGGSLLGAIAVFIFLLVDRPRALAPTGPYAISLPVVFVVFGLGSIRLGGGLSNIYPAVVLGAVLFSMGIAYIREQLAATAPRLAFVLLLIMLLQLLSILSRLPKYPTAGHYETMRTIETYVRETEGPVLMFHWISYAFLNGRPVYDNYGEVTDHVTWTDYRRLQGQLESRYFTRIIIPKVCIDRWMAGKPLAKALRDNYTQENFIVFAPWEPVTPIQVYHRKE